jgi:hypothetical protein
MTRRAGEPPDDLYRTSLALRPSWADRLKAILTRRDVPLAEQVRRWIVMDEWLTEHTKPTAPEKLVMQLPDGSLRDVKLVIW